MKCWLISDLHGQIERYKTLFLKLKTAQPDALFIGGDILPSGFRQMLRSSSYEDFLKDFLIEQFRQLKSSLGSGYPAVFLIAGNDDGRSDEPVLQSADQEKIWNYMHFKTKKWHDFSVSGYSFIPPTPFQLKDWEKFDVSRYVDPGCIAPDSGIHTVETDPDELEFGTIDKDLQKLFVNLDLGQAIILFHTPPYKTNLDRAALDNQMIDHVPLDVHIGSIAVRRFIEKKQPLITLHGHVHESAKITGKWMDRLGRTFMFNAAHDGPELSVIQFDPKFPEKAERFLFKP